MNEGEAKALRDVSAYGCHVLKIQGDETGPWFAYSIGIEKTFHQPDLMVAGLNLDLAHWIINEYNHRVRAGEIFEADVLYKGFIHGFLVMFSPSLQEHCSEHLGWGLWFYGNNTFNVLQLICPDKEGRWPWDEGITDDYRWLMPILSEAPMRGAGPAEEHRAC